jgi:hypothetical protein
VEDEHPPNIRNDKPLASRTGRPRKAESSKEQLVIGALVTYHKWQPGDSIGNDTPAKTEQLAKLASSKRAKVSKATVSRFFAKKFPNLGYKGYEIACLRGEIGMKLTTWQGDIPDALRDLLPEEYGRRKDA